jgi:diguanylate cyclase (GGDEF)-like protein
LLYVDQSTERMRRLGLLANGGLTVLAATNEGEVRSALRNASVGLVLLDPASTKIEPSELASSLTRAQHGCPPELHVMHAGASPEVAARWLSSGVDCLVGVGAPPDLVISQLKAGLRRVERSHSMLTAWQQAAEGQIRDPESGLKNLRYFEDRLAEEVARSVRQRQPLSLMTIELMTVDEVSEELGPDSAGPLRAEMVARICGTLRDFDVVARIEADRLGVVLPAVEPITAYSLAKRVLDRIQTEPAMVQTALEGAYRHLHAAVGIAALSGSEREFDPADLSSAAKSALDEALQTRGAMIGFIAFEGGEEDEDSENEGIELKSHSLPRSGQTLDNFPSLGMHNQGRDGLPNP